MLLWLLKLRMDCVPNKLELYAEFWTLCPFLSIQNVLKNGCNMAVAVCKEVTGKFSFVLGSTLAAQ